MVVNPMHLLIASHLVPAQITSAPAGTIGRAAPSPRKDFPS